MPIPPVAIAALIGAGASIISNVMNRVNQESSESAQKEENELAYQRSLQSTQVQQWKDAGLNPNLIYTQGQAAQYTPVQAQRTDYDFSGLGDAARNMVGMGFSREEQLLRMRGIREDTRTKELNNMYLEASLMDRIDAAGLKNEESRGKIISQLYEMKLKDAKAKLTEKQADALDSAIRKTEQEIVNLVKLGKIRDLEAAEKQLTLDLNEQLKPYGVTVSDPLLARLVVIHLLPRLLEFLGDEQKLSGLPSDGLKERAEQFITDPYTNFSTHLRR